MEKSKRILFVVTQADWGGAQTFIFNAAQEAMRRGFDVLLAYGGEGALAQKCMDAEVLTRKLKKMTRTISPLHDIGAIGELVTLMREWKPDTIFLNSSKAGVVGSIAGRIARVPRIIYRIGGWSFNDPVSPLQKKFRLWMEQLTARLKDVIIVNSPDGVAQANIHHIRPRRTRMKVTPNVGARRTRPVQDDGVVLIPNGIALSAFDTALLPHTEAQTTLNTFFSNQPSTPPIILTIANFYPAKGLSILLDAYVQLVKTFPNFRAVIIGDGEGRAALTKQRADLGLDDIVALPGQCTDAATLLRGADVFVLPSIKEGFPWALLEAMAAMTPSVATDVGGVRWMVENTVSVVPPASAEALASALRDTLNDITNAHIRAAQSRRIVENRFTEKEMWEK